MGAMSTEHDTTAVDISTIVVGERYRHALGDIEGLARSINEIGLLHPIVITPERHLIAGFRRLHAFRHLGESAIPARTVDLDAVLKLKGELQENTARKDFQPSEIGAIVTAIEPLERAAALERQGTRTDQLVGNFPTSSEGERKKPVQTRDKVGEYVGVSGRTVEKIKAVMDAAEAEPEKYGPLLRQMDRTKKVDGAYKQLKRNKVAETIQQEAPPLPTGPFRVIVADPPWMYFQRAGDVTHRGANPYPEMTIEQIRALPIRQLAHDDAVLWLWTTNAHLREAFTVVDAWGFEYKTLLTWVKDRIGLGDWLRGQTEHCLMAARGKPTVLISGQTTVLHGPLREHSRKPDEFFTLVESLCPGSKVELFAREARRDWSAWGAETAVFSVV